jgi:hypothetical protein
MPIIDMSLVTLSLVRLLQRYLARPEVVGMFPSESAVTVSGDPIDQFAQQSAQYALNLYLYHLQEDEYHKNLAESSGDSPPVRFREMGLNLFYLLTAHGGSTSEDEPLNQPYLREQLLMGLAVKALHDYPVLDANTQIVTDRYAGDHHILPREPGSETPATDIGELRITLHPAALDELNKVWTAASAPLRLSAIYQVSVVLLRAEESMSRPVPVLIRQIAAESFQPVWIQATESVTSVTLPGEANPRSFTISPALATVDQSIRILGNGFSSASARVYLGRPGWSEPSHEDVTEWISHRSDTRIDLELPESGATHSILPGLYQLHIGTGRAVSNFSPLAVAAEIDIAGIVPPSSAPGALFFIRGRPFAGMGIDNLGIYLGSQILSQAETDPPMPGAFCVTSDEEIEVRVPAELSPGVYAVRVLVNGISTPPTRWIEVTA